MKGEHSDFWWREVRRKTVEEIEKEHLEHVFSGIFYACHKSFILRRIKGWKKRERKIIDKHFHIAHNFKHLFLKDCNWENAIYKIASWILQFWFDLSGELVTYLKIHRSRLSDFRIRTSVWDIWFMVKLWLGALPYLYKVCIFTIIC